MKKFIAAITILLLFCCPITAFAAETNTVTAPGEQGVAVYGRAQISKDYYEIMLGRQGADTVKLADGITVCGKSDSKEDDGLCVIIIPVTAADEADAYAWMTKAAKDLGEDPRSYYLMFYRDNRPSQPNGHITVSFTENGRNSLRYMDGNAAAKELPCFSDNASLSFEMEQSGYYILMKSDTAPSHLPASSPKTGDVSNVWAHLLAAGTGAILIIFLLKEKMKKDKMKPRSE